MAKRPKLKLTPLQEKFVHEYAIDQNGTQAAIRAGYTENGAAETAYRLLRIVHIRNAVRRELNRHLSKRKIVAETVINRLDDLATVDPAECFSELNHVMKIHDIPLDVRRCIKEITVREEWDGQGRDKTKAAEIVTVKFYDRVRANELLGKNLKMFSDSVDVNVKHTLESLVAQAGEPRDADPAQIEAPDEDEDE
jgi:phage terminase small subunit